MRAIIISDNGQTSGVVRKVLIKHNYVCDAQDIIGLTISPSAASRDADLIVIHISSDPDRALALLAQLRRVTTGRIIAIGPKADARLILQALHDGAEHYLDEAEAEQGMRDALAKLEALRALALHAPGKLICVIKPSGGSGCSTLAANLAVVLAKEHKRCALLDFDLVSDDLTALMNSKPTTTLADLEKHSTKMDRSVFERSLTHHANGVSLLASSPFYEDLSLISARCMREAVEWCQTIFTHAVVDVGQPSQELKLAILRTAEVILLVFRLDFTSLRNVNRDLKHLEKNGIGRERVVLVANRHGQPKELSASEAEDSLGMKITGYITDDPKAANDANNKGVPLVVDSPRSKISINITSLAKTLGIVAGSSIASDATSSDIPPIVESPLSRFKNSIAFVARGMGLAGLAAFLWASA